MLKEFYEKYKALIHKLIFILVFVVFILIFVKYIFALFAPFIVAYIYSIAVEPLLKFLQSKLKIGRAILAIFSVVLLVGVVATIGFFIISKVRDEVVSLQQNLPIYFQDISKTIGGISDSIGALIPEQFRGTFDEALSNTTSSIAEFLTDLVKNSSLTLVSNLPIIITNIFLTILSVFFFVKDKALIQKTIIKNTPNWISSRFSIIRSGFFKALVGYVKAQLIIMSVIMSITVLGLTILRSPYALLFGILIALIDALPIFGSGTVYWPWILFSFLTKNYTFAIGLTVLYGSVFITRQLLEPKVLSVQIGVHPLLTLISIYVGLKIFGPFGLILGPIIMITAKIIMEMGMVPPDNAAHLASE